MLVQLFVLGASLYDARERESRNERVALAIRSAVERVAFTKTREKNHDHSRQKFKAGAAFCDDWDSKGFVAKEKIIKLNDDNNPE